ncbi:hypothetical protein DFH08DRAFT_856438 [Mycena albidolilacea]|uniref:Uncharacterized protein n=1 Tax=Mycena albidolilacea TaxID=1033008 RepID=A0AAD7AA37_9AGAR|nr:hypothetical protein DFH08DRAFT_856438 [Mycena albidolilacea]
MGFRLALGLALVVAAAVVGSSISIGCLDLGTRPLRFGGGLLSSSSAATTFFDLPEAAALRAGFLTGSSGRREGPATGWSSSTGARDFLFDGGFETVPPLFRPPREAAALLLGETETLRDRDLLLLLNGESFFRPRRMSTRLLCVRGTKIPPRSRKRACCLTSRWVLLSWTWDGLVGATRLGVGAFIRIECRKG